MSAVWGRVGVSFALALAGGCGGETTGRRSVTGDGDADGGFRDAGVDAPNDERPAPYSACPDVFSDPVPAQGRDDPGILGLASLRQRALQSRETFRTWAAVHGGTYRYNRQFTSSPSGDFCDSTVYVTSGMVTSSTEISSFSGLLVTTTTTGPSDGRASCHPAVTMDALYEQCLTEVLCMDPRENFVFVHVDARGLLVQCGYVPMNCADDCYAGVEPLILTSDGTDWTATLPGCCSISPAPDCCMEYGGTSGGACGMGCDGMPEPGPGWSISFDANGCARWQEPRVLLTGCCGCPGDAGP